MKKIPLTQGKYAIVDDEDYEELSKHKWCASRVGKTFYAVRGIKIGVNKRSTVKMHKQIMCTPTGMDTDHIDMNGLNNQKGNLRVCTRSENLRNRRAPINNTSGQKGVHFDNKRNKWVAQLTLHGKNKHIGRFLTQNEARKSYQNACTKYHGEFANIG